MINELNYKLYFENEQHSYHFKLLLEQMNLSQEEIVNPSLKQRRQLAFIYLIANYQEAYETYEGEPFYIEAYLDEEITIDGPTYLFDEAIGERQYSHEQILPIAKQILRGEQIILEAVPNSVQRIVHEVLVVLFDGMY